MQETDDQPNHHLSRETGEVSWADDSMREPFPFGCQIILLRPPVYSSLCNLLLPSRPLHLTFSLLGYVYESS